MATTLRMTCLWAVVLVAALAVASTPQSNVSAERILVIFEDQGILDAHSLLLSAIQEGGHSIVAAPSDDSSIRLEEYGEYLYDTVLLLVPTAEEIGNGAITSKTLAQFVDQGGNVMLFAGPQSSEAVRSCAAHFGMDLDVDQAVATDSSNAVDIPSGAHAFTTSNIIDNRFTVGKGSQAAAPILYSGAGMSVIDHNPLVTAVIKGQDSTVSIVQGRPSSVAGSSMVLAGVMQARNNARVAVFGSAEVCSDGFQVAKDGSKGLYGNAAVCRGMANWVTGRAGQLRIRDVQWRKAEQGAEVRPHSVRIKDDLVFEAVIEERTAAGVYRPFVAKDIQLDFTMLDPHVRQALKHTGKGKYQLAFKAPDVYGIFKFVIDYNREGVSWLKISEQVSVLPFRHDEYERFIPAAYPYYLSALSMLVAFVVFGVVFLHGNPGEGKQKAA